MVRHYQGLQGGLCSNNAIASYIQRIIIFFIIDCVNIGPSERGSFVFGTRCSVHVKHAQFKLVELRRLHTNYLCSDWEDCKLTSRNCLMRHRTEATSALKRGRMNQMNASSVHLGKVGTLFAKVSNEAAIKRIANTFSFKNRLEMWEHLFCLSLFSKRLKHLYT